MNRARNGFSLLELLITVSIVGILSAIAVPSFLEMQKRARRTQAKSALAGIYKAEKIFQNEFNTYSTRFDAIGFELTGSAHYNVGFNVDFSGPITGTFVGTASCRYTCPDVCPGVLGNEANCKATAMWGLDADVDFTASQTAFLAGAHIHWDNTISANFAETLTIDNNARIMFVVPAN